MGKGKTSKALKKLAGMNEAALLSLQRQATRKMGKPAGGTEPPRKDVTGKQVEQILKSKYLPDVAEKVMAANGMTPGTAVNPAASPMMAGVISAATTVADAVKAKIEENKEVESSPIVETSDISIRTE